MSKLIESNQRTLDLRHNNLKFNLKNIWKLKIKSYLMIIFIILVSIAIIFIKLIFFFIIWINHHAFRVLFWSSFLLSMMVVKTVLLVFILWACIFRIIFIAIFWIIIRFFILNYLLLSFFLCFFWFFFFHFFKHSENFLNESWTCSYIFEVIRSIIDCKNLCETNNKYFLFVDGFILIFQLK